MAKEQDLPLNPTKISGVCNRLLCCLTYEYSTYRRERKGMPKIGKRIRIGDEQYLVKRQHPLQQTIQVSDSQGEHHLLTKEQWQTFEPVKIEESVKKEKK
jgi:cell fate regulator YaaT (PSP1 superfamily)